MKRIIWAVLALSFVLPSGTALGQYCGNSGSTACNPSNNLSNPGFENPDSIPCVAQGAFTSEAIQFEMFNTFDFLGLQEIDSIRFTNIGNLPCGLCWASSSASNTFVANQTGCISITGTTNDTAGQYQLALSITAWINGGPVSPADSIVIPPVLVNEAGIRVWLRVQNAFALNCSAVDTAFNYQGNLAAHSGCTVDTSCVVTPELTLSPANICAGGSVTLTASGGTRYAWSNSLGSNPQIQVTPASTTFYTVSVFNGSNCSATAGITVNVNNPPQAQVITGNTSITPFQLYTYIVDSTAGIIYTWLVQGGEIQSGQGTHNLSVIWDSAGPYHVSLIQTNLSGCSDTSSMAVADSNCALSNDVIVSYPMPLCVGDTAIIIVLTEAGAACQWLQNSQTMPGQTGDTLMVFSSGNYQALITSGGCSVVNIGSVLNFQSSPSVPVISANPSGGGCGPQTVTLSVESIYAAYAWNTGDSQSNINVNASGIYVVTVSAGNGCTAESPPYNLNLSVVSPPQICLVSVDSASGKNLIVWNKPDTTAIDSYYVFKETSQLNVYKQIGALGVSAFSSFTDTSSIPAQHADHYVLAALDTCGVLSLTGGPHQTIHLSVNQGVGQEWNLIWNAYEGISFSSYYIYRGLANSSLQLVDSISADNTSYTDLNSPDSVLLYVVGINNPDGCSPFRSDNYNYSYSNLVQVKPANMPADILYAGKNDLQLYVYPNPATKELFFVTNGQAIEQVKIYNSLGELVNQTEKAFNGKLNISHLTQGVYMVQIKVGAATITKKWIKL